MQGALSSYPVALTGATLTETARTIALPGAHQPHRLPTFPALERTSVINLNATTTYNMSASVTSARAILFKQAVYPFWTEQQTTAGFQPTWWAVHDLGSLLGAAFLANATVPIPNCFTVAGTGNNVATVATANVAITAASPVPTGYSLLGMSDQIGAPYLYVPKGFTIFAIVDNSATAAAGSISLDLEVVGERGLAQNESRLQNVTLGAATNTWSGTYGALASGWFRPVLIGLAGGAGPVATSKLMLIVAPAGAFTGATKTYTGGAASTVALLPPVIAPGLAASAVPFCNSRVTAASVLMTNVTKALNKEGTVTAGRINQKTSNLFDFDGTSFDQLHPSEKYFYGLEKGFYSYLPLTTDPTEFSDFQYSSWPTGLAGGSPTFLPVFNLAVDAFPHCVYLSDPDGGTSLAISVDWHLEFRNTSVLWPIGVSAMSLEMLHSAQLALLNAGFFFDNVDHKNVLDWVTKGVKALKPFSSLHPVLGVGVHYADKIMSAINPPVAPTALEFGPPRRPKAPKADNMSERSEKPRKDKPKPTMAPSKKKDKKSEGKRARA